MTLQELAAVLGDTYIDVTFQQDDRRPHTGTYQARLDGVEVRVGGGLSSSYGTGSSPLLAIRDYCRQITNKTLVVNAFSARRRDVPVGLVVYNPTGGE
jgi:hypothetical protein